MPTPEERALYKRQLEQLEAENPGSNPIILDATPEDVDWLHPVDEELFDVPTDEQLQELQDALDREPTGPEPPGRDDA